MTSSLPQHPNLRFAADDGWKPDNCERRLLVFVEALILDVARTHPRIKEAQIALWLARVVVGA